MDVKYSLSGRYSTEEQPMGSSNRGKGGWCKPGSGVPPQGHLSSDFTQSYTKRADFSSKTRANSEFTPAGQSNTAYWAAALQHIREERQSQATQ